MSGEPRARGRSDGDVPPALELTHVAKRFGATLALRDATIVVPRGELHALLGENGAGKTTLLHVAFGHLRPDAGRLAVDGRPHSFASPADAIAAGLGMVHQHFRLVPAMTVAENVALGRPGHRLALARVAKEIARLGEASGLHVDPAARVDSLGVAAQQRVEIVKALLRGARVLILDEPTAVLAPSEAAELLAWVRRYVDAGNAAVLITHKLREALGVADTVSVLRRGETVLTAPAAAVDERALIEAMIGAATVPPTTGVGLGTLGTSHGAESPGTTTAPGAADVGERAGVGGATDAAAASDRGEAGDRGEASGRSDAIDRGAASDRARTVSTAGDVVQRDLAHADVVQADVAHPDDAGAATRAAVRVDHPPRGAPPESHDGPTSSGAHHQFTASPTGRAPAPPASRSTTPAGAPPPAVLRLRHAGFVDRIGVTRLRAVTLDIRAGEIVGVAGVEGAGQHELLRLLAGRLAPTSGEATLPATIGFVPEDRHRDALALTRALVDNVVLRGAGGRRGRIRWSAEHARTAELLTAYDVRGGTTRTPAGALSGGNQQKLVLAREIADDPPALVVESPTRGLDVRAGAAVLDRLRAARERGMALVVYSSDLDELLLLADRVLVAHGGRLREVPLTREAIGRALVGAD